VDAGGAARGVGGIRERARTLGLERRRARVRAILDLDVLAAAAQGADEVRTEQTHSEEGDHGGDYARGPKVRRPLARGQIRMAGGRWPECGGRNAVGLDSSDLVSEYLR